VADALASPHSRASGHSPRELLTPVKVAHLPWLKPPKVRLRGYDDDASVVRCG
jgi:hypothetical protein